MFGGPRDRYRPVISSSKLDVFQNIQRRQIVNVVFEGGTQKTAYAAAIAELSPPIELLPVPPCALGLVLSLAAALVPTPVLHNPRIK